MKVKKIFQRMCRNVKFREEFIKKDLPFEIGQMIMEARVARGVTQKQLAKKIGTRQPAIARMENGTYLPSIKEIEKVSKALNITFQIII